MSKFLPKYWAFNPQEPVHRHWLLWIAVLAPLLFSLVGIILIHVNATIPLKPLLSADGFNNFYSLMKVPIGIAALSIPLATLVLTTFKSLQTSEQIKQQSSQNNFANYYKHREEFSEDILPFANNCEWSVNVYRIHEILFPKSKEGNFNISLKCTTSIKAMFKILPPLLQQEIEEDPLDKYIVTNHLNPIVSAILEVAQIFSLSSEKGMKILMKRGLEAPATDFYKELEEIYGTLINLIEISYDFANEPYPEGFNDRFTIRDLLDDLELDAPNTGNFLALKSTVLGAIKSPNIDMRHAHNSWNKLNHKEQYYFLSRLEDIERIQIEQVLVPNGWEKTKRGDSAS